MVQFNIANPQKDISVVELKPGQLARRVAPFEHHMVIGTVHVKNCYGETIFGIILNVGDFIVNGNISVVPYPLDLVLNIP